MEIEGSDGSKTRLKPNSTTVFGRGNGFPSTDLSVSRRHLSLEFNTQTTPRVSFEVLGKNPIWVFNKTHENGKIKALKRFERGELGIDDLFCVSAKNPIWFTLKKVEEITEERECGNEEINRRINDDLSQSLDDFSGFDFNEDSGLNSVDISHIDPVKEFGFLVIGHEFDQYPKQMIRDIKDWDWFLDDFKGDDTDDEDDSKNKGTMGGRRKRKKSNRGDGDVDVEWAAESEGDEATTNAGKVQRQKYSTRSKDQGVHQQGTTSRKSSTKTSSREEEDESEDEDETLGGFVVHDDTVEEDGIDEDDEEEEFTDDEDELED